MNGIYTCYSHNININNIGMYWNRLNYSQIIIKQKAGNTDQTQEQTHTEPPAPPPAKPLHCWTAFDSHHRYRFCSINWYLTCVRSHLDTYFSANSVLMPFFVTLYLLIQNKITIFLTRKWSLHTISSIQYHPVSFLLRRKANWASFLQWTWRDFKSNKAKTQKSWREAPIAYWIEEPFDGVCSHHRNVLDSMHFHCKTPRWMACAST